MVVCHVSGQLIRAMQLIRVMEQEQKDLLRLVEDTIRDPSKRQLLSQFQFARVLHPFEARNEEELGLPIGAIVIITDPRNNNGWYQVRARTTITCNLAALSLIIIEHYRANTIASQATFQSTMSSFLKVYRRICTRWFPAAVATTTATTTTTTLAEGRTKPAP